VVLSFDQVDVFTDELLLGNPVAVVHDADALTGDQMAAFARWTNLSETTFLLAPSEQSADYRVRIFTPARELPFAGHPTLGSARAWLDRGGVARQSGTIVQQCEAGLVRVRQDGSRLAFAAPPLVHDGPVAADDLVQVARALRIAVADIVEARWVDNGPGWLAVQLGDARSVLDLEPDAASMGGFKIGVVGPYPAGSVADFEVRAFTAEREDPVTGSLNAGIAQWLIGAGMAPRTYVASQGTRLRRRGRVYLDKIADDIWVGGDTVIGISGTVQLSAS
jgi:PhzF family phenazine biosynthesis protein